MAEWLEDSVWRFVSQQICRVRMLSQMSLEAQQPPWCPSAPAFFHPLATALSRPDSVYFILPNEQTSCRTSKQMTFPFPEFSNFQPLSFLRAVLFCNPSIGTSLVSVSPVCGGNAIEILSGDSSKPKILHTLWWALRDFNKVQQRWLRKKDMIVKTFFVKISKHHCFQSYDSRIVRENKKTITKH